MITVLNCVHTVPLPDYDEKHTIHELRTGYWNVYFTFQINLLKYYSMHFELWFVNILQFELNYFKLKYLHINRHVIRSTHNYIEN